VSEDEEEEEVSLFVDFDFLNGTCRQLELVSLVSTFAIVEYCGSPSSLDRSFLLRMTSPLSQEVREKDRVEFHAWDKRDDECEI